jgi:hypothetical protein
MDEWRQVGLLAALLIVTFVVVIVAVWWYRTFAADVALWAF